jgi:hypothetical protein
MSPQAKGLVGWWPLDERNGATAYDLVGKNHGIIGVKDKQVIGSEGPCLGFDTAEWVNLGSGENVKPVRISISAWAFSTRSSLQVLFGRQYNTSGPASYGLSQRDATTMYFTIANSSSNEAIASSSKLSLNKWQHWLGTFDGKTVRLYLNGLEQTPGSYTGEILYSNTFDTTIGYYTMAAPSYCWQGQIRDCRIYNIALNPNQVLNLYVNPLNSFERQPPPYFQTPWLTVAANTCPTSAPDLGLTTSALLTLANLSMSPINSTAALTTALQLLIEDIAAHPSLSTTTIQQAVALICVEILCASHAINHALSAPDDLTSLALSMRSQSAFSLPLDDPQNLATAINRMIPNSPVTALAQALWLLIENINMAQAMPAYSIPSVLSLALSQCTVTAVSDTVEMTRAVYLALEPITGLSYLNNIELGNALIGIGKMMNPNIKIATPPLSLHSATPSYTLRKI